nr:PLP-dependent aminotransferase family protein [Kofleriaceae bacterium]
MPFALAPRSRAPLFEQIYEHVRRRILAGDLAPGAALPGSRRMASDLGVSRTTVLQAIETLRAEGYVVAHARSGVRVARARPDAQPIAAARADAGARPPRPPRLTAFARDSLALRGGASRLGAAPRAFRPGVPALDLFPIAAWTRYVARSHARARAATLEAADPAGHRGLREAIARDVASARGVRASADQVFVTNGMAHAIEEALRIAVAPGERVWIEDPTYLGTRRAVAAAGARAVPVPVDDAGLDVAAGIARAGDARAAIVTPSHHYPLGVTTDLARRIALLAWARRARALIVEDDYDSEFRHRGRPVMSLAGLDDAGCVVYAGTFSKTMYPGLRIGFAIVPARYVDAYAAARAAAGNPASILEQDALAAFIGDGQFARHVRRMRVAYRERAEAFADALRAECAPALDLGRCDTGMQVCARLARGLAVGEGALRDAAAARGVELGALADYYLGRPRMRGAVFGFGCARPAALRAGCRELALALGAAVGQGSAAPVP